MYKNQKYLNVNADNFIDVSSKYHAYLLGFIWADGYIHKSRKTIRVEIVRDDAEALNDIFSFTGKWSKSSRKRSHRQEQVTYECCNAKLVDWLLQYDYNEKSTMSPNKIYNIIPDEYKIYFLRGWVDGDGCFYLYSDLTQFTLAGGYDQDWSCIENIFKENDITYQVQRRITMSGKSSAVRISSKDGICKLGNMIYRNFDIGLRRKYDKFCSIDTTYTFSRRKIND